MEFTRTVQGERVELRLSGRLDAQSADSFEREMSGLLHGGARLVRLGMAEVPFISSAGIRVILKLAKELKVAQGTLSVISPSDAVTTVFRLTGLMSLINEEEAEPLQTLHSAVISDPAIEGCSVKYFDAAPNGVFTLNTIGGGMSENGTPPTASSRLKLPDGAIALGWGAFGSGFDECRSAFGEFMALGGSAITLPTDGDGPPDFIAAKGSLVPEVEVLHALLMNGEFGGFFQFSADAGLPPVPFSRLVESLFSLTGSDSVAMGMIAETDGLVGAALQRSPAIAGDAPLMEFPGVRDAIALTSEPAWSGSLAVVCGMATRLDEPCLEPFIKPFGSDASKGHFHGAALSYRALPTGLLNLAPLLSELLESQNLLGLLHLVNDSRPINGAGESRFQRGAVWFAPLKVEGRKL